MRERRRPGRETDRRNAASSPGASRPEGRGAWVLGLQAAAGNAAVARLLDTPGPLRASAGSALIQRLPGEEAEKERARLEEEYGGFLTSKEWGFYGAEDALAEICRRADTAAAAEAAWREWLLKTLDRSTPGEAQKRFRQAELKRAKLRKRDEEEKARLAENRKRRREKEESERAEKRPRGETRDEGSLPDVGLGERREPSFYGERVDALFPQLLVLSEATVRRAQIEEGLIDESGDVTTKGYELLEGTTDPASLTTAQFYFYIAHFKPTSDVRGVTFSKEPLVSMPVTTSSKSLRGGRVTQAGAYSAERGWQPEAEGIGSREQAALMRRGVAQLVELVNKLATEVTEQSRSSITKKLAARHYLQRLEQARFPPVAVADALAVIGAQLEFWTLGEYYAELMPMRQTDATTATGGLGSLALLPNTEVAALLTSGDRALRTVLETTKTVFKRFINEALSPENRKTVEQYPSLVKFLSALLDLLAAEAPRAEDLQSANARLQVLGSDLLRSPERVAEDYPFFPVSGEEEKSSTISSLGGEFGVINESGSFFTFGEGEEEKKPSSAEFGSELSVGRTPPLAGGTVIVQPREIGGHAAVLAARSNATVVFHLGRPAVVANIDMGGSEDVELFLAGPVTRVSGEEAARLGFPADLTPEMLAGIQAVRTRSGEWYRIVDISEGSFGVQRFGR